MQARLASTVLGKAIREERRDGVMYMKSMCQNDDLLPLIADIA